MPVHTYTNWNQRPSDQEEQIEPWREFKRDLRLVFFYCLLSSGPTVQKWRVRSASGLGETAVIRR